VDDGITDSLDRSLGFGSEIQMPVIKQKIWSVIIFGPEWIIFGMLKDKKISDLDLVLILFGMFGDDSRHAQR
jgi:hypothetical protein